jgi:hypothetical protein
MQDVADQSAAPATIGADLCAIFVSLELSRSTWLPHRCRQAGGKMSKHSVSAGDIAALLARDWPRKVELLASAFGGQMGHASPRDMC